MTERWAGAVEEAADALGERLLEQAEGRAEHTYEDIAAAALSTGLQALLRDGPQGRRLEAAGAAIYGRMHDAERAPWQSLGDMDRDFWLAIARDALAAGDRALLQSLEESTAEG